MVKSQLQSDKLPRRIIVDGKNINDECEIANNFNNYFLQVGSTLAKIIENSRNSLTNYLTKVNYSIAQTKLTYKDLETAFFSIKRNKAPVYDDLNSNIVLESYN